MINRVNKKNGCKMIVNLHLLATSLKEESNAPIHLPISQLFNTKLSSLHHHT